MPPREPPLNAVRAFAAAARHLSFTRAAHELHVTHSAISRQVKSLEDFLGAALFERRVRQVALTAEGQQFFAEVEPALAQVGAAARALRAETPARAVRIDVRPSFAVRWLIPRLPSFALHCPGIEPRVVTSTVPPGQAAEGFDIAVRRGREGWPASMRPHPFLEDEVLVVGAPALFAAKPLDTLKALPAHVLLSARTRRDDWDAWKKQVGAPRARPAGRLQFDHLHFVLQAAIDGLGIALAPTSLLAHDLASGRLQSPLPALRMPLARYYYGLSPDASPEARQVAAWFEQMGRGAG
ncbi:LysR family glycine cleavage system transcriptional activator [Variovorax sp. TBS-050B]|uniref:LysR substrate-binding domain-containing protein n=1 Tax=Variovorax sp. TBS-050B TaxID=2940551 RepID=UPI0024759CD0|nr:LysR substrate-binding domain-containing protein [Variovorax sp. TBS-050B]MDH6594301.1 LysR family glycine cleavage system transcriptional activator [Variovorax sp. TBS-050B]